MEVFNYEKLIDGVAQLKRGMVWCKRCGQSQTVDAAACMYHGWPKCHGETMTIDSPEEQAILARQRGEA